MNENRIREIVREELEKNHSAFIRRSTITVMEAANYLGVSDDTIYNMCKNNEIPHIRVRRNILLRKGAIDEWMSKRDGYNPFIKDLHYEEKNETKEKEILEQIKGLLGKL